jgi:uncharacterized protein (TIGR00661 family)
MVIIKMKLSIIIPTYNEEEYLPYLLESIKRQDFTDYEVIIADAQSEDRTREIAHKYGCKIIDGGMPSVGRNRGAEIAQGEFLLFLDADVILTKGYLTSALQEFIEGGMGISITQILPLSDKTFDIVSHDFANFFMRNVESIKPHGAGCYGILTHKKLHEIVGGFDENLDFGEDTDYIEKIGYISSFKVLRNPRLFVSTRRTQTEGRTNIAYKYAKSTFYQFTGRTISADELDYRFDHSEGKKQILYGVCGEGMGHAIRSGVIIEHLLQKNQVTIFAGDRAYEYLREKFDNVHYIEGFNTVYEANEVKNRKTFIKNIRDIPLDLGYNLRLMYNVAKAKKPHLIISDFEFYSNLLSKVLRIPLISLDNMHVITQCDFEVKNEYKNERFKAASVVRSFIQMPRYYLITSYFFPPVKNPAKVKMFPPILRDNVLRLKPIIEEHILVYQTSDSNLKLLELLNDFDDEFIVYGFHKNEKNNNITFKNFNEDEFFDDLASARAVITNGGFNLISEALYLKKPIFSIPVKKQFEQILNAIYLDRLDYGKFCQDPNREDVEKFFSKLDFYRENIKSRFKHDRNRAILHTLDDIIAELT